MKAAELRERLREQLAEALEPFTNAPGDEEQRDAIDRMRAECYAAREAAVPVGTENDGRTLIARRPCTAADDTPDGISFAHETWLAPPMERITFTFEIGSADDDAPPAPDPEEQP